MSTIIATQLQTWRQKCLDGSITQAEMRDAIAAIRKERIASSEKSAVSREKKVTAKTPVDADALLSKFGL